MSQQYIIGIDGGTQSTKVVIFDLQGNIISSGNQPLKPLHKPRTGVAEHPDDDLWKSLLAASQQAMQNFTGDPAAIIGIGLCTIRCCRADLKADGSLASPVINWMDQRLSEPYLVADSAVKFVTTSSGYLTHRLTGNFKDTAANYEGMWPIDKKLWNWSSDEEVLNAFNIPPEQLFTLVKPGTILGKLHAQAAEQTGLPAGLPVVATANDKAVEALGAGLPRSNIALISLGTYIGGMIYADHTEPNGKHYFTNMAAIPNHYLCESGGVRQGMGIVSWLRDLLGAGLSNQARLEETTAEEILNQEASQVPPGSDGLVTVPEWLAPPDKAFKRGVMIGFHAGHTRAHLYRSILEAIALTMKNRMDAMCQELNIELDEIIISGGGSNSDLFMQIFADVFAVPTVRSKVNNAASLGAAICASVATDAHSSFDSAAKAMVKMDDRFVPIKDNTAQYQEINDAIFRSITEYTDEILIRIPH